jgi:hypothetical protein
MQISLWLFTLKKNKKVEFSFFTKLHISRNLQKKWPRKVVVGPNGLYVQIIQLLAGHITDKH